MLYYPKWVSDFFDTNRIRLERIHHDKYKPEKLRVLKAFLSTIVQKNHYFALPYVYADQLVVMYVGGATDLRELTELNSILYSALGTAYVESYQVIKTSHSDQVAEQVLLSQFPVGIVRLQFYRNKSNTLAADIPSVSAQDIYLNFELVNRVIHSLNHRPQIVQLTKRPVGKILRDFYLAQKERDIETVQLCFNEIKTNASLGEKNLIFLEVQTLAIAQQWETLLNHTKLKDLLDDLLPSIVLCAILDALTAVGGHQLLDYTISPYTDVKALQNLYRPFKSIFNRLPEIKKDQLYLLHWQQWFIGAVLMGKAHFFEQLPYFVDAQWCTKVLNFIETKSSIWETDDPKTWHLTKPNTAEQVFVYLKYCIQCQPQYWQEYWQCLEETPPHIRLEVEKNAYYSQIWEKIAAYCNQKLGYHWQQWFNELLINRQINTNQMLLRLQNESELWPMTSFDEQQWLKVLNISDRQRLLLLRNAMPILIDWLMQNCFKLHEKTVSVMLSLIVEDEQHYPGDFSLVYVLSKYWQYVRVSHQYDEHILASLIELWEKAGSALTRSRALKIVELFKQMHNLNAELSLQKFEEMILKS